MFYNTRGIWAQSLHYNQKKLHTTGILERGWDLELEVNVIKVLVILDLRFSFGWFEGVSVAMRTRSTQQVTKGDAYLATCLDFNGGI